MEKAGVLVKLKVTHVQASKTAGERTSVALKPMGGATQSPK